MRCHGSCEKYKRAEKFFEELRENRRVDVAVGDYVADTIRKKMGRW